MKLFYSLAYAVGFTPWERAGAAASDPLTQMFAREEAERGGPGSVLDLGCGSGAHAVELAKRGWVVTAVDVVPAALRRAERRMARRQVSVALVKADATALTTAEVGTGFDFFLDVGCYQGLSRSSRVAMGRGVSAIANPGATLLVLAFAPKALPRPLPRGADRADLEAHFNGWRVVDTEPAAVDGMPRPLRRAAPMWYRLRLDPARCRQDARSERLVRDVTRC